MRFHLRIRLDPHIFCLVVTRLFLDWRWTQMTMLVLFNLLTGNWTPLSRKEMDLVFEVGTAILTSFTHY